jgi:hypothetical protein
MRYRLRSLLIAITVISALLGMAVQWWRKPYVLFGTYSNGVRAWEQTERRTFDGRTEWLSTTRYYPNGRKSFESHSIDGVRRYWSPAGDPVSGEEWWQTSYPALVPVPDRDPTSRRPWPTRWK